MKIKEVKDYLTKIIQTGDVKTNLLLIGHTGIGKTSVVYQVAREANLPVVQLNLFTGSKEDFTGIMQVKDDHTTWLKPSWMINEKHILLLDEFNRVLDPEVKSITAKLIEEKRVHTHFLHPETFIVLTGNPVNSVYDSYEIDPAWQRRITQVNLEFDAADFIGYIKKTEWDSRLVRFLEAHSELIFQEPHEGKILPNPASWDKVNNKLVKGIINVPFTDSDIELLAGDVGYEPVAILHRFMKNSKKEIVLNENLFLTNPEKFVKDVIILQKSNLMDRISIGLQKTYEIIKENKEKSLPGLDVFFNNETITESIKLLFLKILLKENDNIMELVGQVPNIDELVDKIVD